MRKIKIGRRKREIGLRRFCICVVVVVIVIYILGIFYGRKNENGQIEESKRIEESKIENVIRDEKEIKEAKRQRIEYKENETIMLKDAETSEIVAIDTEDYLRCVVASEMSAEYDIEALKAQAVVARTYLYKKIIENAEEGADICNSASHCQAYYTKEKLMYIWENFKLRDEKTRLELWAKINEAVASTKGEVITYNNELINAFFHASSPKATESVDQIWGNIYYPYLISVINKEDETYENRESHVYVTFDELEKKIKENVDANFSIEKIDKKQDICINEYTTSKRVKSVKFGNVVILAEKLRTMFGLKSTLFEMEIKEEGVIFNVMGYGHGVGMSQVGANYLASCGKNYEEIIKHYYTGVEISKLK